jgi:sulfur carrier protein ThiS
MKIRLRCFTGLRRYAPEGKGDVTLEMEGETSVGRLLQSLGVPDEIQLFIAVNGRKVEADHLLRNGDEVVIFTNMEGG